MNDIQLNHKKVDVTVKEIDSIFYKLRPENFSFKQNERMFYRLAFILSGKAVYNFSQKNVTVCAGDLIFIKKNESYTVKVLEDWEHIVITFDLYDDENSNPLPFNFLNKTSRYNQFEDLFKKALDTYNNGGFTSNLELKSLMYQIISMTFKETEREFFRKTGYKGIKDAVKFIESNYKEKITVENLAKISGYSISHFARLFKEIYSVSPVEYVNRQRIERAKSMLRTEMFTLTEIAEECGFLNVYYFSRIFKQLVGVTPKKY